MQQFIIETVIYLLCFMVTMYAISVIDFAKFSKRNQVIKIQLLYILLAMALATLVGNFIIKITYFIR